MSDYREKTRAAAADPASAPRVIRGGSWDVAAQSVRAACRYHDEPSDRDHDLGFRCAEFRPGL